MKSYLNTIAAAAVVLAGAAPAFANAQLIASAGLSPAEAAGLSLTEIAQHKFNREAPTQDRQAVDVARVAPQVAAGRPLNAVAVASANAGLSVSDQQPVVIRTGMTVASRSVATGNGALAQLIASAGLSPADAAGMSLGEIAAVKFARDADGQDAQ